MRLRCPTFSVMAFSLYPMEKSGYAGSGSVQTSFEHVILYIYNIYPELRIGDYRFHSGKGAEPLWREHQGSKGEY